MTFIPYFHVGILVPDIEEAMARFSEVLGLSFRRPVTAQIDHFADPTPREFEATFTYSYEGPPYFELIEMADSLLHSPSNGEGLHHVGIWSPNLQAAIPEFEAAGLGHEASILGPRGEPLVWFNKAADLHGTRIEFLDDGGMRATWDEQFGPHVP